MSDSISACLDEQEDYVDRCKRYGEEVEYRDGCPSWTGVHATQLKLRAERDAKAGAAPVSPSRIEDKLRRERDAYKKAKKENDDRFMGERDQARAERDDALRACEAASAEREAMRVASEKLALSVAALTPERDTWRRKAEETAKLLQAALHKRDVAEAGREEDRKLFNDMVEQRDRAARQLDIVVGHREAALKQCDRAMEERDAVTKQRDIAIEQQGQIVNQRDGSIKEANRLLRELKEARADLAGQKEYTNEILMKASRITGERDEARRSLAAMHQDWMRVALAANKFQTQEEPDELLQRLAKEHEESDKRAKEVAMEKARGGFAGGYKKAVEDIGAYLLQEHAYNFDKAKKTDCCEEMKRFSNRAEAIAYLRNEILSMRA